jgi:YHS domain-containing protein
MEVDRNAPSGGSFDLDGTTYYFCSTFCRAKFAGVAGNER